MTAPASSCHKYSNPRVAQARRVAVTRCLADCLNKAARQRVNWIAPR